GREGGGEEGGGWGGEGGGQGGVGEGGVPEAVEVVDVVGRIRRRARMLGRVYGKGPRQLVEERIPVEAPGAVKEHERRAAALGEHPDADLALPDGDRAFAHARAAARPGSLHRSAATSTAIVRLPARPALVPSPSISPRRRRTGKFLEGYSSAAIGLPITGRAGIERG